MAVDFEADFECRKKGKRARSPRGHLEDDQEKPGKPGKPAEPGKHPKPEGEEPDPPPLCTLDLDSLRYACPPQSDLVPQYSFKLWVRIENCYLLNHSSEDDRYFIFFFKFAKINADLKVETLIGSQILLLDILLKLPNSYCLNFFCFNW